VTGSAILATPAASSALDAPDVPPPGAEPPELVPSEPPDEVPPDGDIEVPPWLVVWVVPVVGVVLDGTSPAGKFGDVEVLEEVVADELVVVVADELAVVDVTAVVLTGANGVGIGVVAVVVTMAEGVGIGVGAVVVTMAEGVGIGVGAVVVTI
jgi:hypothetical protein